jgi:protoheme IX farnesyltransferase
MARLRFHHFAWGLLAYNLAVVLGGAFVRASISGDGCGAHWPSCQGELFPNLGEVKTLIEFGHRASAGLLLPLVVALVVWALRAFPARHPARLGASLALLFTMAEAAIGAGLVLYRLVAHDASVSRAIVMPAHLVATFLLLMSLTLTAWWGSGGQPLRLKDQGALGWMLGGGMVAMLLLGVSGAITALGDTLFPAKSLSEALRHELSPSAHFLLGLRVYHPFIAMAVGLYVQLAAALTMSLRPAPEVQRFGRAVVTLFLIQMGVGLVNLGLLAPIGMQLIHLLVADLFWISLVLMSAAALARGVPRVELSSLGRGVAQPGGVPQPALTGPAIGIAGGAVRYEVAREAALRPSTHGAQTSGVMPIPGASIESLERPRATWRDYVALTKPRVISLLLFTVVTAMAIAAGSGEGGPGIGVYLAVGIGFYMAAGAANAINMVLERDLDLRMGRTARRPTVTNAIPPRAALEFALALMVSSFALLWGAANLLTAILAMAGLAFYVIVYTLLLKRRTWLNIVIGGAAGAFPPLVGWAAVAGDLSALAWCLFGIIFLWTPVHFWALAIMLKEDYARAGVPMLPVVRGVRATVTQIVHYTLLTIALSTLPLFLESANGRPAVGGFYLVVAAVLNAVLLLRSWQLYRTPEAPRARSLFKYSMLYLALLFLAMAVDRTDVAARRTTNDQRPTTEAAQPVSGSAVSLRVSGFTPTLATLVLGRSSFVAGRSSFVVAERVR